MFLFFIYYKSYSNFLNKNDFEFEPDEFLNKLNNFKTINEFELVSSKDFDRNSCFIHYNQDLFNILIGN